MKEITFSDLKDKEVINMCDCKRLGYINDLTLDAECGRILSVTVRDCNGFLPSKASETVVCWENIQKIGDDIVFVDICRLPSAPPPSEKKKFFFS